jgi:hypothetical protein
VGKYYKNPIATVREALENQIKKDYVLSIEIERIEIDEELTQINILCLLKVSISFKRLNGSASFNLAWSS